MEIWRSFFGKVEVCETDVGRRCSDEWSEEVVSLEEWKFIKRIWEGGAVMSGERVRSRWKSGNV